MLAQQALLWLWHLWSLLQKLWSERGSNMSVSVATIGCHLVTSEPLLCLEEVVEQPYITAAVNIPLQVDVGAGFGEPSTSCGRFRRLRVLACSHSDRGQIYPKRAHITKALSTSSRWRMIAKLKAARWPGRIRTCN